MHGSVAHEIPARNRPAAALQSNSESTLHWCPTQQAPVTHMPCPQLVPAPSQVAPAAAQSSGERSWHVSSAKQHAPTSESQGSSRQLVPAPANSRPALMHEKASAWLQLSLKQQAPVAHGSSAQSAPGRKTPLAALQSAWVAAGTHVASNRQQAPWP